MIGLVVGLLWIGYGVMAYWLGIRHERKRQLVVLAPQPIKRR